MKSGRVFFATLYVGLHCFSHKKLMDFDKCWSFNIREAQFLPRYGSL